MIERNGSIFDTEARFIGHGVNTQGKMGAGIAKQFRSTFGENYYRRYVNACRQEILVPGGYSVYLADAHNQDVWVVNLASQEFMGKDARYSWLFSSVWEFTNNIVNNGRTVDYGHLIALPEIGCGIGGLEWPEVKRILICIEEMHDYAVEFEVWHYGGK